VVTYARLHVSIVPYAASYYEEGIHYPIILLNTLPKMAETFRRFTKCLYVCQRI